MNLIPLTIEGIQRPQANELIKDLHSIKDVETFPASISGSGAIEFKEPIVSFLLIILSQVSITLIVNFIIKFFKKEKSTDKKPIIINYKNEKNTLNINIIQGDNKETIKKKLEEIFKDSEKK